MLTVKFHKSTHGTNKLFYSIIIITKKASPYSGKLIEEIGYYHPIKNKWNQKMVFINYDRLAFWLNRGVTVNKSLYLLIKSLLSLNLKK